MNDHKGDTDLFKLAERLSDAEAKLVALNLQICNLKRAFEFKLEDVWNEIYGSEDGQTR